MCHVCAGRPPGGGVYSGGMSRAGADSRTADRTRKRYLAVAVDAVPFPGSINAAYILNLDLVVGYVRVLIKLARRGTRSDADHRSSDQQ